MIYVELENKSPKQMSKVILTGSLILVILFCFVGVFGYATFVNDPELLCSKNILDNNYYDGITLMQVSNFTMLFSVVSSFPLNSKLNKFFSIYNIIQQNSASFG